MEYSSGISFHQKTLIVIQFFWLLELVVLLLNVILPEKSKPVKMKRS